MTREGEELVGEKRGETPLLCVFVDGDLVEDPLHGKMESQEREGAHFFLIDMYCFICYVEHL